MCYKSAIFHKLIYYIKRCFGYTEIDKKNQTNCYTSANCWSQTDDDYDYINETECLIDPDIP